MPRRSGCPAYQRRPNVLRGARAVKDLAEDSINGRDILHAPQANCDRARARANSRRRILEMGRLADLRGDVGRRDRAGRRIDRSLPRGEHQVPEDARLREMPLGAGAASVEMMECCMIRASFC